MNGWPRSLGSMDRVESSVLDHLVSLTFETGWATRFEKNAKNLTYLFYRSNWSKVLISLQSDGWQQRPALTTRQTWRQQARHIDNFVNYNRLGTKSTISWWGLMHMCNFQLQVACWTCIFLSAVHYYPIAQCTHLTVRHVVDMCSAHCALCQQKINKLLPGVQHVQLTVGHIEAIAYVLHCTMEMLRQLNMLYSVQWTSWGNCGAISVSFKGLSPLQYFMHRVQTVGFCFVFV